MNPLKLILIPLISLTFLGCASAPSHIIISPDLMTKMSTQYIEKTAQFSITDLRTSDHVIQIMQTGEAAELISPQPSLSNTINQIMQENYQKQGLLIQQVSPNNIEIIIDKALVSIDQETMSYTAVNELTIRVKIKNTEQTMTQKFNSKGKSNGPLTADIAVIERDFNQQLSKMLTRILTNDELINFIK